MSVLLRVFRRATRRIRSDRKGTAAVETALMSPLLILMFLGTVEITQLIRVESKLAHAAQTMQDIVAGQTSVTSESLLNAFAGGQIVMTPFAAVNLSAAVASVVFNSSGVPTSVDWQEVGNNAPAMTTTFACATATGMSLGSDSVIVVQATYTYVPIVSYLMGKSFTLTQTAYGRPRNTAVISGPGGSNGPTGNC